MSLAGTGVVAIWHDLLPEATEAFFDWHSREHMPERVGIPGFRRGRRYVALEGKPQYFNLYEADSAEVLGGQDYLNRLNAPTPWTREVVVSFREVARSICRVAYSAGIGQGGVISTVRFDVEAGQASACVAALRQQLLPPLVDRNDIAGVHLCLADEAISRVETAEKKARADATAIPTWVLLVEGGSAPAVAAAADQAQEDLRRGGWTDSFAASTYRLQHSRCKTPWAAG